MNISFEPIIPTSFVSKMTIIEVITTTSINLLIIDTIHIEHSVTSLNSLTHCILYRFALIKYHFFSFSPPFIPFQLSELLTYLKSMFSR